MADRLDPGPSVRGGSLTRVTTGHPDDPASPIPDGEEAPQPARTGKVGSVFAAKYRLLFLLGRGGMGEVWQAEHLGLGSMVALKIFDLGETAYATPANRETALARFTREARSAASLRSAHVARVFDTGVDHGVPFIAMELLEGETLATRLDRRGSLSPAETLRILTHVGRAMAEAHQHGIIHRDLKPENIFIVDSDEEEVVKVLDFGIAKVSATALDAARVATASGNLMGTPPYMSPEQAGSAASVDARSDLWSMGVLAFECLTGRLPFDSQHVGELILQICAGPLPVPSHVAPVPPGFDVWWARACCRDPEHRFQSARGLYLSLADVLEPGVRAPLSSIPPHPSSPPRSRATSATLDAYPMPAPAPSRLRGAIAMGAALLGLVTIGLLGGGARREAAPVAPAADGSFEATAVEVQPQPGPDLGPFPARLLPTAPVVPPSASGRSVAAPPASERRRDATPKATATPTSAGRRPPASSAAPSAAPSSAPRDRLGL